MTLSPSTLEANSYDFPFQFMIDARSTPANWDKPTKSRSQGILSPFQWSPPRPSNDRTQKFTGDITSYYHGPNFLQDDDSFSFFDQSFFFMDQLDFVEQTPHPTNRLRDSEQRAAFASMLTKCHRQRISTIVETPVSEDTSSEDGSSAHEAAASIDLQPRRDFDSEIPQNSGISKLLDYIVPYPTQRVKKHLAQQKRRKSANGKGPLLSSSIKTDSASSSESECSSLEEEWITQGFFEILKGH